jgi:quercetin dioxygenase-like cupin family protein
VADTRSMINSQNPPGVGLSQGERHYSRICPRRASPRHKHDVTVFAYILEGMVESQLEGKESKIFKQSEMEWEVPGTVHVVSRNASKTERAKLLVFFVGEEGKAHTVPLR